MLSNLPQVIRQTAKGVRVIILIQSFQDIPEAELFTAIESIPAPLYNSFLDRIHEKVA